MSQYTTELRYICEYYAGETESKGYDSVDEIVGKAEGSIFENYPIFDETYRKPLNKKILRHFYTREIGAETVGLWKLWLNNRMNEIMPLMNQYYESALLKFNPLYEVDLTTTHAGNKDEEGREHSDVSNKASSQLNRARNEDGTEHSEVNNNEDGNSALARSNSEEYNGNGSRQSNANMVSDATSKGNTVGDITRNRLNAKDEANKYSDTPEGSVSMANIDENAYLTNVRLIDGTENENTREKTVGDTAGESNEVRASNENATSNEQQRREGEQTEDIVNHRKTQGNSENNRETNETVSESKNDEGNSVNDKTKNVTNTESYIQHVVGKNGGMSYSKMLMEFRDTFVNVDKMIIDNLNDLFMMIW